MTKEALLHWADCSLNGKVHAPELMAYSNKPTQDEIAVADYLSNKLEQDVATEKARLIEEYTTPPAELEPIGNAYFTDESADFAYIGTTDSSPALLQVGSNEAYMFTHYDTGHTVLNLTGEHETFPLDRDSFGYKYFDDEQETSMKFLQQYKDLGRWFGQIALDERHKVIKQWKEMAVEADFEWIHDAIGKRLFNTNEDK